MKATFKASGVNSTVTMSVDNSDGSEVCASVDRQKAPTKARKSWKKPAGMPRRPLSAYNLFFQEQRKKLLGGEEGEADHLACSKRKHRKTHGKIGFADLAKSISQTWHDLTKEERQKYESEAQIRKQDYFRQLSEYKKKQNNTEGTAVSDRGEDEERTDYAALLVSMAQTTPGHSKSGMPPLKDSRDKDNVKRSIVGSAIDSNGDLQRRMLEESINRQLYTDSIKSALESNLGREGAICLVQPNMSALPMHLAHDLVRNNLMMINYDQEQLTGVQQIAHLNRKSDSLLHPGLQQSPPLVFNPSVVPGQNGFHAINPLLISQSRNLNLSAVAQQPVAGFLLTSQPAFSGIILGQTFPSRNQIQTQLLQNSIAANSQNMLRQQQSDVQNLMLLSRLQSQGVQLQHAHR